MGRKHSIDREALLPEDVLQLRRVAPFVSAGGAGGDALQDCLFSQRNK